MNLIFQTPSSYDDCRRIADNDIEWRLASSADDSWTRKDLHSTSTSTTVSDLEPAHYVVRLIVENEGGITATSAEVNLDFGMKFSSPHVHQDSITVDVGV